MKLHEPFVKLCVTAFHQNKSFKSYYTKALKRFIYIKKNTEKPFVKLREPFVKLCVTAFHQNKFFKSYCTKDL